jgi:restriction system protein
MRDIVAKAFYRRANAVIDQHLDQLARRRAQLVREDPYGKVQLDRWAKELDYFMMHHVVPVLTKKELALLNREGAVIVCSISERIEKLIQDRPLFKAFSHDLSPTEFEVFCAEQLKRSGWNARVTLQSRDQGVDVIAEKAGIRVVLQCKLYSGPVGNQAVQEISAGRLHEQANWGAVVTNSSYTSSAEQLASTNGILLLHYSDLANLDSLLQAKSPGVIASQKPMMPNPANSARPTPQGWTCPACHAPVPWSQVSCTNCGIRLKWPK